MLSAAEADTAGAVAEGVDRVLGGVTVGEDLDPGPRQGGRARHTHTETETEGQSSATSRSPTSREADGCSDLRGPYRRYLSAQVMMVWKEASDAGGVRGTSPRRTWPVVLHRAEKSRVKGCQSAPVG